MLIPGLSSLLGPNWLGQIATGVLVAAISIALFVVLQSLYLYLQGWSPQGAVGRSTGRTVGIFSGMLAIGGMAIVQFGQVVDVVTQAIASAPIAATQLVTLGLGVIGLETGRIGTLAFITAAVSFAAFTLVLSEVRG